MEVPVAAVRELGLVHGLQGMQSICQIRRREVSHRVYVCMYLYVHSIYALGGQSIHNP